jgi:hypothetical protein
MSSDAELSPQNSELLDSFNTRPSEGSQIVSAGQIRIPTYESGRSEDSFHFLQWPFFVKQMGLFILRKLHNSAIEIMLKTSRYLTSFKMSWVAFFPRHLYDDPI